MSAAEAVATQVRGFAAWFAVMQVDAHVLPGTAGNTIGQDARGQLAALQDGFTRMARGIARPLNVPHELPPRAPPASARECWGVDAAFSTTGGSHVCAGRFARVPMGKVATYFSNPARQDALLQAYLAFRRSGRPIGEVIREWAEQAADTTGPQHFFSTLTPRIGFATADATGLVHHKLIWGESCVGRRHFDAAGLVNAAFAVATGDEYLSHAIHQWGHASVTEPVPRGAPVLPGDLLFDCEGGATEAMRGLEFSPRQPGAEHGRWRHIGLCVGDEKGSVVQAEDGPSGVTVRAGAIDPRTGRLGARSRFNHRARVPDAVLARWKRSVPAGD